MSEDTKQSSRQAVVTEDVKPVKGEHIFPATIVEPMAVRWKELTAQGRHDEAGLILEDIVIKSSQMFMRLAQYEGFHHTVDIESLVLAAQARTANWLIYWDPKKGKLFSWMSKCAKHVFLSEVARVTQHRRRYHATSENLEKFAGSEDHAVDRNEAAEAMRDMLHDLSCRWGDKQSILCIRFHIECIIENPKVNKKDIIRAGAYASGVSFELSKFFYNWALFALRDAMYDKLNLPYSDQDLLRLTHSYTYIPDLLNIVTWQQLLKMVALLGGNRIKLPTIAQLDRAREEYHIYLELGKTALDPESMAKVAKSRKISPLSATEIYERMSQDLNADRSGEHSIYD